MADSDPSLICSLEAQNTRTNLTWEAPHNVLRYEPPTLEKIEDIEALYRDLPVYNSPEVESKIRLSFDHMPKDPRLGFVFGSDMEVCDIFCGRPRPRYPIDDCTFCITINDKGEVFLEQMTSFTETAVKYGEQKQARRRIFRWMLFPGIDIIFTVAEELQFKIWVPPRETPNEAYSACLKAYNEARRKPVPQTYPGNKVVLQHEATLRHWEKERFWCYMPNLLLGTGISGQVFLIRDASDGTKYAAKEFFNGFQLQEANLLEHTKHDHIVQYVESSHQEKSLLVMEYMEGETLLHQYKKPLDCCEIAALLHQCLSALEYLHKRRITHRDIKPQNILFKTRKPLCIKLADFGLATQEPNASKFCGTIPYCAPEMYTGRPYDLKVDIWSLAVVILQLLWDRKIPVPKKFDAGYEGCKKVVHAAKELYQHAVSALTSSERRDEPSLVTIHEFVMNHMLKFDPEERLSAKICLERATAQNFPCPNVAQIFDKEIVAQRHKAEDPGKGLNARADNPIQRPGVNRANTSNIGSSEFSTIFAPGSQSLPQNQTEQGPAKETVSSEKVIERQQLNGHPRAAGDQAGVLVQSNKSQAQEPERHVGPVHSPPSFSGQGAAKRTKIAGLRYVDELEARHNGKKIHLSTKAPIIATASNTAVQPASNAKNQAQTQVRAAAPKADPQRVTRSRAGEKGNSLWKGL